MRARQACAHLALLAFALGAAACSPEILDGHFACDTATARGCPDGLTCVGGTCVRGGVADGGGADGDAGRLDSGTTDAGDEDSGLTDGGPTDAGSLDGGSADGGRPLVVFVTSAPYAGDIGSLLDADFVCNVLAVDTALPGTFRAWLSVPGGNAADRISAGGPWNGPEGGAVHFRDRAHLLSAEPPSNRMFRDENGTVLPASTFAWTGTGIGGTASGGSCTSWTDTGGTGSGGYPNDGSRDWTLDMEHGCGNPYHFYCFEDPSD